MRVGIVKPDWGFTGGFEVVVQRVARHLASRGHSVEWALVPVAGLPADPFGVGVPEPVRARAWEAFRYLAMVEAFRAVDASRFDLVLSTQPPSFVVDHPRQLALFYHHVRIYYDLSEAYVAAGLADPADHAVAQAAVRRVDAHFVPRVSGWLAGSESVAGRLREFHGLTDRVGIFHAGSELAERQLGIPASERFDAPLCVSRHEFSKRTELFVHAMRYLPGLGATMVGSGGRLPFLRDLDARLSAPGVDVDAFGAHDLWLNPGAAPRPGARGGPNVVFEERLGADALARRYRDALCVVTPAYREDYGLTAIEAMASGKPVIACEDGGGLPAFVEDGVTGFVVAPTGRAIAEAVGRLAADRGLARTMGAEGRRRAAGFGWARAWGELDRALEQVADGVA
jgi:glycosyltransferase involved in cell wall biosynthesis